MFYDKRYKIFLFLSFVVGSMTMNICSGQTVSEAAIPTKHPEGAPHRSDVSIRLFRKKKDHSELAAGKAFHVTRADWSYIRDPKYIKKVHDLGWTYQGTINAVTHNIEHAKRDKAGKPMLDHFSKPGRYWADNDNESYRQWYLERLEHWIEVGVDSIQRDEPTTANRTPISDAAKFLKEIHLTFDKQLGRRTPMSCNLGWNDSMFGGKGLSVSMLFDFGIAEIGKDKVNPEFLLRASRDAQKRGKRMVYTSNENLGVATYRLAIAGCYATGMQFMVPWDQFGGVKKPRVFSRPEDLADLYGFVRANAHYLDGYEDVAAVGYRLEDTRYGKKQILKVAEASQVTAFIRAKPGDSTAPVVVHLIEWGKPHPFKIKLRPQAFFGDDELNVVLQTPPPYDGQLHERAETSKKHSLLSRKIALRTTSEDDWRTVEVPALKPWSMLIISKRTSHHKQHADDGK